MREIVLTQGKIAVIDDEDFEKVGMFTWCASKRKQTFYAFNGAGGGLRMMHHIIIGSPPKGQQVDHINGNGLDNRKENLRFVTNRQNSQNRNHRKGSSLFPGVSWCKPRKKWVAGILINGKSLYLGGYETEEAAFNAYLFALESNGETFVGERYATCTG
jgi:hypothetical protein